MNTVVKLISIGIVAVTVMLPTALNPSSGIALQQNNQSVLVRGAAAASNGCDQCAPILFNGNQMGDIGGPGVTAGFTCTEAIEEASATATVQATYQPLNIFSSDGSSAVVGRFIFDFSGVGQMQTPDGCASSGGEIRGHLALRVTAGVKPRYEVLLKTVAIGAFSGTKGSYGWGARARAREWPSTDEVVVPFKTNCEGKGDDQEFETLSVPSQDLWGGSGWLDDETVEVNEDDDYVPLGTFDKGQWATVRVMAHSGINTRCEGTIGDVDGDLNMDLYVKVREVD